MSRVLIVVDYQNEWVDKNSEYFVGDVSEKIEKLNELISRSRASSIPIIFTVHVEQDSQEEFAEETSKVEVIKGVDFQPEKDILIKKYKISPFYQTELESKLKELDATELLITGILTNLCVRSLTQDAYDRDYQIKVITDTCVAFSEETHNFTIKDLKETRPEIEFLSTKELNL